jgi:hypothetical protein
MRYICIVKISNNNIKTMKTKYNKSAIMKRAWTSYKSSTGRTFPDCLKGAWLMEKMFTAMQNITAKQKVEAKKVKHERIESTPVNYYAGEDKYYRGSGSYGRYFGD